jgi:hypothetical protein
VDVAHAPDAAAGELGVHDDLENLLLGHPAHLELADDNREAVDAMNRAAAANGGRGDINPVQDLGFLYNRSLSDPDGHIWEAVWMNPAEVQSEERASPEEAEGEGEAHFAA